MESQQRSLVRERTQTPSRSRVMQRGGLLEGFSPRVVTRVAMLSILGSLVLVALAALGLLVEMGQHDLFLGVVIVVVAALIAGIALSVTAPAWLTARGDRKAEPRNLQGQLVGASRISPTPTLATVAVNVGHNVEQYRVRPELFERIRSGATVVGLTVTPGLNHVQTLTVIRRDRQAVMKEPPVTREMRVAVWLPLISLAALAGGLALGCLIGALLPLGHGADHPLASLVLAAVLAGAVALGSRWYGNRLVGRLGTGV